MRDSDVDKTASTVLGALGYRLVKAVNYMNCLILRDCTLGDANCNGAGLLRVVKMAEVPLVIDK